MAQGFTNQQNIVLPLAVAQGGTGSTTAAAARTALGVPPINNSVISASCGSYGQSTATPTQVTNLTCSITTSGGYVQIVLQPDNSGNEAFCSNSGGDIMCLYVVKAASILCRTIMVGPTAGYSNPNITFNDFTVAGTPGTYVYHIFMSTNGGTAAQLDYAQLTVVEL